MLSAPAPPALVNRPPAMRSPFDNTARVTTVGVKIPPSPGPSADQLAPSQRAMLKALTPPAEVKAPPATRSPLGRAVRAHTKSLVPEPRVPEPSGDQAMPFQR